MKRIMLFTVMLAFCAAAAVYSRQDGGSEVAKQTREIASIEAIRIQQEEKNPWTHLSVNNAADQFQFAIVTDRTGGHRAKIFARAVDQLNLIQPEFVLSVGDLIEGYTVDKKRMQDEWAEFQSYVNKLQMPFFYVPGNHDLTNKELVEEWGGRFGRRYYHFLYKDVLFLCMNSEDPVGAMQPDQVAYFEKILNENKNVRWTFCFLHKPIWTANDLEKNGWAGIERSLAGRNYTVFCGHVHRYQKFVRQGMNYYQLATTGGGSRLRGVDFGEFDQITWITMKKDGPVMANLLLEGILPEDLKLPDNDEKGRPEPKRGTVEPFLGQVSMDGKPLENAYIRFFKKGIVANRYDLISEGRSNEDGTFEMSTYKGFDGVPAGEYIVVVVQQSTPTEAGERPRNLLPERYSSAATSPLRFTVKPDVRNRAEFVIEK